MPVFSAYSEFRITPALKMLYAFHTNRKYVLAVGLKGSVDDPFRAANVNMTAWPASGAHRVANGMRLIEIHQNLERLDFARLPDEL